MGRVLERFVSGCSLAAECLVPQLLTLLTSMAGHLRIPRRWFFVALCRYCSPELVGQSWVQKHQHVSAQQHEWTCHGNQARELVDIFLICAIGTATQSAIVKASLFFFLVFKLVTHASCSRPKILHFGISSDEYIV